MNFGFQRTFFGLVFCSLSFFGFSQLPTKTWVGLQASPSFGFPIFESKISGGNGLIIDSLNAGLKPRMGASAEFLFHKQFFEIFAFETGLRYHLFNFRHGNYFEGAPITDPYPIGFFWENHFHWLGIPFMFSARMPANSKFFGFISAGVSFQSMIRLGQEVEIHWSDGSISKNNVLNPWGPFRIRPAFNFSLGFCNVFSYRWILRFEPYFHLLPDLVKGESWSTLQTSFGIKLGVFKGI